MARGPTMSGFGENRFKAKALRWLDSPILKLDFANKVCHNGAILLIFEAGCTESVLDILSYPEFTTGPTMI